MRVLAMLCRPVGWFRTLGRHLDPMTWHFVSVLWALCGAASLVTPWGHPFALAPFYGRLEEINANAAVWGWLLLAYAVAGLFAIKHGPAIYRAAFGIAGTILWGFFAIALLAASLPSGIPSWGGLFDGILSIGCLFASIKATAIDAPATTRADRGHPWT